MKPAKKIVLIDTDTTILKILSANFKTEGYELRTASSGKEAMAIAQLFSPDLIVTEMILPDMDGVQLCQAVKSNEQLSNTAIVFLTNRCEEYAEVAALKAGASDYITKPIKLVILNLRIQNVLIKKVAVSNVEQGNTINEDAIVFKDLLIDKDSYVVYKGNKKIQLPRKEFELLFYMGKNPNKIIPRKVLLNEIWSGEKSISRTVDSHIMKIRKKIGEGYINTVIGIGYKLDY